MKNIIPTYIPSRLKTIIRQHLRATVFTNIETLNQAKNEDLKTNKR
jgi:hypothetical protein